MLRSGFIAIVLAGQGVLAQDLSVYRVNATPGPWNDATHSVGYSVSFTRAIAPGSRVHVGLRASYGEARDSVVAPIGPCIFCSFVQSWNQVRLRTTEFELLVLPYATRSTRLEVGVGTAMYTFRGSLKGNGEAPIASLAVSRRLLRQVPVWATVAYVRHFDAGDIWLPDGPGAYTPEKSIRFGLLLRR